MYVPIRYILLLLLLVYGQKRVCWSWKGKWNFKWKDETCIEVDGKEVLIANVGGKFYAISDRCGHMNALLSTRTLTGNIYSNMSFSWFKVWCYYRKGAVRTYLNSITRNGTLPQTWQKFFENVGQLVAHIKTYDQIAYETRIDDEDIILRYNYLK